MNKALVQNLLQDQTFVDKILQMVSPKDLEAAFNNAGANVSIKDLSNLALQTVYYPH